MDLQDVLISILISSGVAAGILTFGRQMVEARVVAYYDEKLARLQDELRKDTDANLTHIRERLREEADQRLAMTHAQLDRATQRDEDLMKLRLAAFPSVVAFTYRLRDSAKAIMCDGSADIVLHAAFLAELDLFKEMLYDTRFGLEQAGQFDPAHRFKNLLGAFSLALKDNRSGEDLTALYAQIDAAHTALIRGLADSVRVQRA